MVSSLVTPTGLWQELQALSPEDSPRSIVVVDCRFSLADPQRGRSLYEAGHLPGAVYLDLNQDLASAPSPDRGRHPLPDVQNLAETLAAIGITFQHTWVVAYDDARFAFASRLWWLLRYLGHDRVSLLDGGIQGWQAQGYPLTTDVPTPQPGHFIPHLQPHLAIDRQQLKIALQNPGTTLIDAREAPRYRGETEPIDPIAGHIPGAINAPWQGITTSEGWAQPLAFHRPYWESQLPQNGQEEAIVVYCGSGVTACVNLFSLHLAGLTQAKLYPGSWSEWCHCETAIAVEAEGSL